MISIVVYKDKHLKDIIVRSEQEDEKPESINTGAISFVDGENVLAIFGSITIAPGVIRVWGLVSSTVSEYRITFVKKCIRFLDWYMEKNSTRRIEMSVKQGFTAAVNFARILGFEYEGHMSKYGHNGSDYLLFARVS
jgi:hypothetical protein